MPAGRAVGSPAPGRGRYPAVGLGAYRIGDGDGSDTPGEWSTGHSLADQLAALNTLGIDYIGLYRYDSLFNNTAYPTLAAAEQDSVAQIWRGD